MALLTTQVLGVFGLYQVTPPPASDNADTLATFLDVLKIVIPALLAYLASRMQAKREQRTAQATIEEATRQQIAQKEDRLTASWESMTTQARELLSRAYADAAEATAARRAAEGKLSTLEQELASLQRRYDEAVEELDELRKRPRKERAPREGRSEAD